MSLPRSSVLDLLRADPARLAGIAAALCWTLLCLRWFDAATAWRPAWLAAVPPALLLAATSAAAGVWLKERWPALGGGLAGAPGLAFVVGLAVLFRLPLLWQGSAGYVTPDGALSGIVALHARDGVEHLVFVPHVPYSGSLKSHLTAALALGMDPSRAFALASVAFYALFAAAVHRLATLAAPGSGWVPLAAGLYVAFAPPFLTHYSLSNDGNYVEVLALGGVSLVLAIRWLEEDTAASTRALAVGLLLGAAFWCHILAVIYAAGIGLAWLSRPARLLRSLPALVLGFGLGDLPGILWNAHNGWESLEYVTGGQTVGSLQAGPGIAARALAMLTDLGPVLMGYDAGYGPLADAVSLAFGWGALLLAATAMAWGIRQAWPGRSPALFVLLGFAATDVAVTLVALPYIPGNPRYLQFLVTALAVVLALFLERRRWAMVALVGAGAVASLAQGVAAVRSDAQWRGFVSALEHAGVRHCYAGFEWATKINFLSAERVVCSAKLGPTTTEYFFDYRRRVEAAPGAALVAVNEAAAEKLERRLERLGIPYRRLDLMKPVLLPARKVDPEQLFPDRDFPWR